MTTRMGERGEAGSEEPGVLSQLELSRAGEKPVRDETRKSLEEQPGQQPPVAPDAFQQWMIEHREEVLRYRGKLIAVHSQRGIIASADNYALLVDELERRAVPDSDVVIEFVSPVLVR